MLRVAVVGSSGFIGKVVLSALVERGHRVIPVRAPRITTTLASENELLLLARNEAAELVRTKAFHSADVIVNAAGVTSATSSTADLIGANATLPLSIALAATSVGCPRLIHVSSAAVVGRGKLQDRSIPTSDRQSAYAKSKAAGEALLKKWSPNVTIIYRPTSVHGPHRSVTRKLQNVARSPWSICAAPGNDPTPQTHVLNVGRVCAYLADYPGTPPSTLIHPWEGWTTRTFLRSLGGKDPRLVPRSAARSSVRISNALLSRGDKTAFLSRRFEMLLFGQPHEDGWLSRQPIEWMKTAYDWDGQEEFWSS